MIDNQYDSKADTLEHIKKVVGFIGVIQIELMIRAHTHDDSKLLEPEKSAFDRLTPILKDLEYGSPEYRASLAELQPAIKHHYLSNSHHPEYYINGIDGMNLVDIVEMYCDWKAAGERTKNGSMSKSIEINKTRFKISDQLAQIFINTEKLFEDAD